MEKSASQILELVLDRIKKYGPSAAIVGGGLAGLNHLVAMKKQKDKDDATKDKGDNVLYIDLPKAASIFDTPSNAQYLLDGPVALGTTLAAGTLGYQVVNSILQNVRKKKMHEELDRTKQEYAKLLSQKIYGKDLENKTASDIDFQNIETLALSVYDSMEKSGMKKEALTDPTIASLMTSLPGLGALITGILAHNYWYNKQKDIELGIQKQEAEKEKKAPTMITLRTESDPEKVAGALFDQASGLAGIKDLMSLADTEKEDKKNTKKIKNNDVYSPDNTKQIDENTVVITTDDGDTQVDAIDPAAAEMLQKYKEIIAKSLATGVNLNNEPSNEKE